MGRRVAVAADDQQSGQGQALFRPDNVHDALARIVEAEQPDAVLFGVVLDLAHHARDLGIGDVVTRTARRHVMIGHAEGQPGLRHLDAAFAKLGEGVKRAFMDVVAVHPQQRLAVVAPHDLMGVP